MSYAHVHVHAHKLFGDACVLELGEGSRLGPDLGEVSSVALGSVLGLAKVVALSAVPSLADVAGLRQLRADGVETCT